MLKHCILCLVVALFCLAKSRLCLRNHLPLSRAAITFYLCWFPLYSCTRYLLLFPLSIDTYFKNFDNAQCTYIRSLITLFCLTISLQCLCMSQKMPGTYEEIHNNYVCTLFCLAIILVSILILPCNYSCFYPYSVL